MTVTEKIMDLSKLWHQAAFVFPHFHRCDVNWDETYREFLPRTMETKTDREHALLMAEFLNRLGDGHTDVSFSAAILKDVGFIPFALDYVDGTYYAEGERVLGFDGRPMTDILEEAFRYVYHVGDFAPRLRYILPMILGAGSHTVETESRSKEFTMTKERPNIFRRQETEFAMHDDVLRIAFDDFLRDRSLEIREMLLKTNPRAVILDIRENIGGMTKFGADLAQLFISGTFGGCKKWTRTMTGVGYAGASQIMTMREAELSALSKGDAKEEIEQSLRIARLCDFEEYEDSWGDADKKAVFDGPVVLLTSRKTVSAAEDFVAFFRSNHRGTLIGASTCGTSGTPLLLRLNCGSARVCSVGYQLKDGTEFLGIGIQPDLAAEPTMEDLRAGRDPVLEAALNYLKN